MPTSTKVSPYPWVRYDKIFPIRNFYVDPDLGNNKNSGNQGHPVASLSEVARRLHTHLIEGSVNIYLPEGELTDLGTFMIDTAFVGLVSIRGTRTLIDSGEITALQVFDSTAKEDQRITDSTLPTSWTASDFVGKLIVLTTGANMGAYAWVNSDLGSKEATVSPFYDETNDAHVTPDVGDEYSVYDVTKIIGGINGNLGINGLACYDIFAEFDENIYIDPIYINGGYFYMYSSIVDGLDDAGDGSDPYGHCAFNEGNVALIRGSWIKAHLRSNAGSYLSIGCNLFSGFGTAPTADGASSKVSLDLPCTGYGEQSFLQSRSQGKVVIRPGAWYMAANQGYGLYVRDFCEAILYGKIWGFGITDYGVYMGTGARVSYAANMIPDFVDNPIGPTYPIAPIDLAGVIYDYADLSNAAGIENLSKGAFMSPSHIGE